MMTTNAELPPLVGELFYMLDAMRQQELNEAKEEKESVIVGARRERQNDAQVQNNNSNNNNCNALSDETIGFDTEWFVDRLNANFANLICNICACVMRNPVLDGFAKCGHVFCQVCFETAVKLKPQCPMCRVRTSSRGSAMISCLPIRALIEESSVRCPNHERGCTYVGQLGADGERLLQHLRTSCDFEMVKCQYDPETHPQLFRKQMIIHEMDCDAKCVRCEECSEFVPKRDLPFHSSNQCPENWIKCPNDCYSLAENEWMNKCNDSSTVSVVENIQAFSFQTDFAGGVIFVPQTKSPDSLSSPSPPQKTGQLVAKFIRRRDLQTHSRVCLWGHLSCPFRNCKWNGLRIEFIKHCAEETNYHMSELENQNQNQNNGTDEKYKADQPFGASDYCRNYLQPRFGKFAKPNWRENLAVGDLVELWPSSLAQIVNKQEESIEVRVFRVDTFEHPRIHIHSTSILPPFTGLLRGAPPMPENRNDLPQQITSPLAQSQEQQLPEDTDNVQNLNINTDGNNIFPTQQPPQRNDPVQNVNISLDGQTILLTQPAPQSNEHVQNLNIIFDGMGDVENWTNLAITQQPPLSMLEQFENGQEAIVRLPENPMGHLVRRMRSIQACRDGLLHMMLRRALPTPIAPQSNNTIDPDYDEEDDDNDMDERDTNSEEDVNDVE